jgi:hypothetical protein
MGGDRCALADARKNAVSEFLLLTITPTMDETQSK